MKFHFRDFLVYVVSAAVVMLSMVLAVVLDHEPSWPLLFIVIGILVMIYHYLRTYFDRMTIRNILVMTRALDEMAKNLNDSVIMVNGSEELVPFYEALERLRNAVNENDVSRQELLNIVNSVAANMDFDQLLEDLLPRLLNVTSSQCCALYMANNATNKLELKDSVGFSKNIYSEFDIALGEGFIGSAAANKNVTVYNDIPDDTKYIVRTFLGKIKPKSIMVVPIINQDQIAGVLVFSSIYDYSKEKLEMVELTRRYVSIAIANGLTYEKTKRLTNELKFQNKLIQNLNDELEKKSQERNLFLNSIIDNVKDCAIYAYDRSGNIIIWNKSAEQIFGFPVESVLSQNVRMLYAEDEIELYNKRLESVKNEKKYVESGWRKKKDGSRFYYDLVLFSVFNERGDVIGYASITRDITTSKYIESALWFEKEVTQTMISSSPDALVITDERGFILHSNSNSKRMLNNEQLLGRRFYELFSNGQKLAEQIKTSTQNLTNQAVNLKGTGEALSVDLTMIYDENISAKKILLNIRRVDAPLQ